MYTNRNIQQNNHSDYKKVGGLVAQAVRSSPPTAGVPSSRLGPSIWVSWWTKWGLGRFFTGFLPVSPTTNFIPPFLHTHPFHFIRPCDGASGVVGWHPCYSWTYNIGASFLDPTLCWTRVEDIYVGSVAEVFLKVLGVTNGCQINITSMICRYYSKIHHLLDNDRLLQIK